MMGENAWVALIAMTPFGELRASIPVAIFAYKMNPLQALILSVTGNMVPVFPLLIFLEKVSDWLRKYRIFDASFEWLFSRTRRYNRDERIDKYGSLALIPIVAIPLPITGAWTGCVIAFVFGIRHRYAFATILAGVLIAGIIVLLSCMGVSLLSKV